MLCQLVAVPTCVGTVRGMVELSPSWPPALSPQQYRAPPRTPQVWFVPVAITVQSLADPTRVGVERVIAVPSPSWPVSLLPQQYSAPARRPQVYAPPVAMRCQSL